MSPQHPHVETPTSNLTEFGDRAYKLGKWNKIIKVGPFYDMIGSLIRRDTRECSLSAPEDAARRQPATNQEESFHPDQKQPAP